MHMNMKGFDPAYITIARRIDGKHFVRQGRYYQSFASYEDAQAEAKLLLEDAGGSATIEDRVGQIIESTIRRRADREGYRVIKSRKVNLTPDDQGEYMLIDVDTWAPVCGYHYDASLEEVAKFLADEGEAA